MTVRQSVPLVNKSPLEFCVDYHRRIEPRALFMQIQSPPLDTLSPDADLNIVLVSLWKAGEQDRLQWLRANARLQPLLMGELALVEFCQDPTEQTITSTTIPLIEAASNRIKQDAQCSKDPELTKLKIWRAFRDIYVTAIKEKWKSVFYPNKKYPQDFKLGALRKMREVMFQSIKEGLPSPVWLVGSENMYSLENCDHLRKQFGISVIKDVNILLKNMFEQKIQG